MYTLQEVVFVAQILIIVGIVLLIGFVFDFWLPFIVVALTLLFVVIYFIIVQKREREEKERLEREAERLRIRKIAEEREKQEAKIIACRKYGISSIEEMTGLEFESFVAAVLRNNSFSNVDITKSSGDYGVDITARKNGVIYAIQCKHYKGNVGVSSVQEVFSGGKMYGASEFVVVTNSSFTKAAINMAREIGVHLWNGDKLIEMMN